MPSTGAAGYLFLHAPYCHRSHYLSFLEVAFNRYKCCAISCPNPVHQNAKLKMFVFIKETVCRLQSLPQISFPPTPHFCLSPLPKLELGIKPLLSQKFVLRIADVPGKEITCIQCKIVLDLFWRFYESITKSVINKKIATKQLRLIERDCAYLEKQRYLV